MPFRIDFENPSPQTDPPTDRFDGYDLNDAIYDYVHEGVRVGLVIDDVPWATFEDYLAAYVTRELFTIASRLLSLPSAVDEAAFFRRHTPALPAGWKVYQLVMVDWISMPLLAFATDGAEARIYQRSAAEGARPSRSAMETSREHVLDEIRSFLTRYLDDLIASFPFLSQDAIYTYWRERMADLEQWAAVPGPHPERPGPEEWRTDSLSGPSAQQEATRPAGDPHDDPRVKAAFDDLMESWKAYEAQVAAAAKDDEKA